MCSQSNLDSTKRRTLIWNNINCVIYFLLIALGVYFINADRSKWSYRRGYRVGYFSIYTVPFIFVYCFVGQRLENTFRKYFSAYICCTLSTEETEPYNRLSTHIIRGFIMVHDFVFLVLISVSVIFCSVVRFFVQNFAFYLSCFYLQSYRHVVVD